MFGGTLWGGNIGGVDDHSDKEREPPRRPISLEFPDYVPPSSHDRLDAASSSRARDRICHTRTFTSISDEDLSVFNIKFNCNVELIRLLPNQEQPFPFDKDLESMLAEISVNNNDAFRETLRMEPLPGHAKPRLTYARNFFGSLEDLARYWDNSMDQYYHVPAGRAARQQLRDQIKQKLPQGDRAAPTAGKTPTTGKNTTTENVDAMDTSWDAQSADDKDMASQVETKEVYKGYRFGNGEQANPGTRVALVKNLLKMVMHKFTCRDHEPMPAPREKLVVRGVRVQSIQYQFCVARIPKDMKMARARMVEGPLMAVHCREELRFKQTPAIPSADSVLTGSATLEGTGAKPVVGSGAGPKSDTQHSPFVGERFDLLREVGCMLILATQRNREGKNKKTFSGADKWWATQQRWGGGPLKWGQFASEVYEDEDPSWSPAEKILQEQKRAKELEQKAKGKEAKDLMTGSDVDALIANNAPTLPPVPGDPMTGPRKKKLRSLDRPPGKDEEIRDGKRLMYVPAFRKKWHQDWQILRPNTPMWDDKIIYKHIGKPEESEFDEIYMISSVNHHVALLRMKVHPEYLAWLEAGEEVPDENVAGLKKNVLHVERSTWFDMFDVQARREFLTALWRVMSWLNRDYVEKAEVEKV
ncbi:hypothetical protein LTR64_005468 [Lithohypha guttulata]|uniref:Uncharacterized protein n=1 Tax=Lithohypha guttulata TaxID=1690604 RepID=A0AAN7SVV7_9EURO|nr:hypothetical protein LTR51_002739 [Lithohypha guttulata]KAK5082919.1 hypothetical protein LTR05_006801 [Lithohypha guttulata]